MKLMQLSHFVIGIISLAIFLISGLYMLISFPELYQDREEIRMMYRSSHIYILMSSLINLMVANYLLFFAKNSFLKLRSFASMLILVAPILLVIAFIYEPPGYYLWVCCFTRHLI